MGALYSEAVRARCRDPRRAGGWPEDSPEVGTGEQGSLESGTWTRVQVHVSPGAAVIDDARFRVFGCSAALASARWVADALVGRDVVEARGLVADAVARALDLPADKVAMAALATAAAAAAVADWEGKAGPGDRALAAGGSR
ncbi:MAG: iron-sulfur cluster assembly scaffold protein [Vicinamibacterales bacterium]